MAVCVGINKYKEVPQLESAVNDAKIMAGLFKGYGFDEVYLLTDERATKRKIINELLRFKGEAHENDLFVLYFAGHGETHVNAKGEDEGFLITVGTRKDNVYETGISMGLFKDISETMPNKHMLYLVDCCYAGYGLTQGNIVLNEISPNNSNTIYLTQRSASKSHDIRNASQIIVKKDKREKKAIMIEDYKPPQNIKQYLNRSVSTPAVQIITAGGKGETARETAEHGLYTSKLIASLSGNTNHFKDGIITAAELAFFVRQHVSQETQGQQNPIYGYLKGNGDVLFITGQQEKHTNLQQRTLTLTEIRALYKEANSLGGKGEYLFADQKISKGYSQLKRHQTISKELILDYLKMLSRIALVMAKNDLSVYYAQEVIAIADNELDKSFGYNNLGVAYGNKGDYDRAIEYYQKALKIDLKKLDPEHPEVAIRYNNLGLAYGNKGDYDRAIEYYQKALKIALKKLGPEHPKVAISYNNLGLAYRSKGDYDRAIEYFQNAVLIGVRRLGKNNPYTKFFQKNLDTVKK